MTTYTNPIRELIIRELKELFEAYTFESIASPTIYRGRQIFDPDSEPPPLITILPRVEESTREYGMAENAMPIDIICLARMGTQNPSELGEAILGELLLCVFGKNEPDADGDPVKVGGMTDTYVDDVSYRSGGIDAYPDEAGQSILHVGITVIIKYTTNLGDPYSH